MVFVLVSAVMWMWCTQYFLPVLQSFTSIVGPNGSGKSNVIDSMLFVFGFRANKIRSKKISVLIHNSENHKDLDSCTVSVHFQKIIDTGVSTIVFRFVKQTCPILDIVKGEIFTTFLFSLYLQLY